MSKELIQIGEAQEHYNVAETRILKYSIEMYHEGLKEHKLVSAPEFDILENKVNLQEQKWIEKWDKLEVKRKILEEKEVNLQEAKYRTMAAEKALKTIDKLLTDALSIDAKVEWKLLKKRKGYSEVIPPKPEKKPYKEYPPKPDKRSNDFVPKFTVFEKLFKSKKEQKILQFENKYSAAINAWKTQKDNVDIDNKKLDTKYKSQIKKWKQKITEREKRKDIYLQKQSRFNKKIDELKRSYLDKDANSIIEYCNLVLNNSKYPNSFPKSYELEYNQDTKILVVEYELPSIECFPKIKDVKYIATRNELNETELSKIALNKMFDESIYKIALRTLYELFKADTIDALEAISFNGWVNSINKATGNEETNCIVSIQAKKDEFLNIDLSRVEPKTCFINLKGVASSKLSTLTAVQPILQISKTDKRFVNSYDVADELDDSTNIAAMNWEDFEHLIREIFEKEFSTNGGEVKVTQASRDGGVDAIAFDPDPIRGGKIVIQAKRYTNTVGVASVRDLYGTVVNEGATKGILVTTANYGSDAYEFAKGKPLTLLNGSNLLNLLEKHGHHAKIDIREAKKILAEQEEKKFK